MVSKSGAEINVKTPSAVMASSSPEILKLSSSSSSSLAATVPIANWFSGALKEGEEVNIGATSFRSVIKMLISFSTVSVPSVKDRLIS